MNEGKGREEKINNATRMMIDESFKTLPQKYHSRIPSSDTILHPQPTATSSTGLKGRTAVSEVLEVTDEIQELILRNASEEEFFMAARKNGFISLHEDAVIKALRHEIPYEEMNTFRSKVGSEAMDETEIAVDNSETDFLIEDIMENDETTTS